MTENLTPGAAAAGEAFALSAARGMLESLEHYGRTNPAVGDGRVSTPAWYASRLNKVMTARGDQLPGDGFWWWGDRYAAYATQLLEASAG